MPWSVGHGTEKDGSVRSVVINQIGIRPRTNPVWISMVGVAIHEWTASPWRTELEEAGIVSTFGTR